MRVLVLTHNPQCNQTQRHQVFQVFQHQTPVPRQPSHGWSVSSLCLGGLSHLQISPFGPLPSWCLLGCINDVQSLDPEQFHGLVQWGTMGLASPVSFFYLARSLFHLVFSGMVNSSRTTNCLSESDISTISGLRFVKVMMSPQVNFLPVPGCCKKTHCWVHVLSWLLSSIDKSNRALLVCIVYTDLAVAH